MESDLQLLADAYNAKQLEADNIKSAAEADGVVSEEEQAQITAANEAAASSRLTYETAKTEAESARQAADAAQTEAMSAQEAYDAAVADANLTGEAYEQARLAAEAAKLAYDAAQTEAETAATAAQEAEAAAVASLEEAANKPVTAEVRAELDKLLEGKIVIDAPQDEAVDEPTVITPDVPSDTATTDGEVPPEDTKI